MSDTLEKVKEIVVEQLSIDAGKVTPEATFTDDLGADSLDIVQMIMELEQAFDMDISDEEAEKFTTVGSVVDYIESLKS
jgi:acyl carrier protein